VLVSCLIALAAAILVLLALHQNHNNTDEDRDDIDIQLQRVAQNIHISGVCLFEDDLRVEDDVSEENGERSVEDNIKRHRRREEHVEHRDEGHVHEGGAEHGSEVQVRALLGEDGHTRKAQEHRKSRTERRRQDVRMNCHDLE